MEAINAYPHHGFDTWLLMSYFYDGMSSLIKQLLKTMCGGDFMSKNPEEAMDFLNYVPKVSRGWDEPNKGEVGKMKSQPNALNAKAGMYTLNEDIDMKAKVAAMTRRLEELELKKIHEVQVVFETPVQVMPCSICQSYEHLVDECPTVPAVREMFGDQANYKSPVKYKDPGCPTISVMIGGTLVEKALLDLGASVNLLPYSIYKQLGLGELKPTPITLSLADGSMKIPRGMIEDVLVQVDNFYYPVVFFVFDTDPIVKETNYVPIILGRPFLATSNAIINYRNGLMQLMFDNMTLELNIFYISKKPINPEEEEGPEEVCIIDTLVEEHCNQKIQEELNESLRDLDEGQLPTELKYAYLEENKKCPVVISSSLTTPQEECLLEVLRRCKKSIGWQISDLKGIRPLVYTHHICMEEEAKPIRQPQRRLNPHMQEVVRAEVLKLLQADIIYPISNSPWVSPTQVVPKKSGIIVVQNDKREEVATRLTPGWREGSFPLPFIDQVLESVSGHSFYCFLDGHSGYFQTIIDVEDQEKTTFTCPFKTYAYKRMAFGLCNAPATFQQCMLNIFNDMVEHIMEVFMDDITIYGRDSKEFRNVPKSSLRNFRNVKFTLRNGKISHHEENPLAKFSLAP
uniref:Reverse transcriptase domain-containing protein n=1 Tax=Vitis vinifera TaxID=29760 RepID=A5BKS0_VITVI|nr:hypothetical protein VITISV_009072 [Vitis vinifera]